ncbi:MAG: hypothetical protein ACE5HQ_04360 [Gemmatimonadota bacterium]
MESPDSGPPPRGPDPLRELESLFRSRYRLVPLDTADPRGGARGLPLRRFSASYRVALYIR